MWRHLIHFHMTIPPSKQIIAITDEQLSIKELCGAPYHEAGHKIVYECFGGTAEAFVFRNRSGIPDMKEWLGQCGPWAFPRSLS